MYFAKHGILTCICHTLQVSRSCANIQQLTETLKLLKGQRKTDCREADGWQPKSPRNSIWQGKTQPAGGDPESNLGCPGPRDIKRDGHNWLGTSVKPALSISSRAKVQSQPRPSPRWGNGRSRAQWRVQEVVRHLPLYLMYHWQNAVPVGSVANTLTEAFGKGKEDTAERLFFSLAP